MTDFSVPQRMSLGGFLIYFLKYLRLTFNITIVYLVCQIFASDESLVETLPKIVAFLGLTVVLALVLAAIAFFQIKFHVEGGNLIYRHSLINRATTTIPLSRIHTLRTRQGLLYRLFGLRGILFDTLAAQGDEIELILSESDWQSLLNRIELQEQPQPADPEEPPAFNPVSSRKFSNKDLVLDALCQNHLKGMLVLGSVVAFMFNLITDVSDNAIDKLADYLETHLDYFAVSVAGIAVVMVATYMVSLILWLGKVILRYFDLTLDYDSKTLTFTYGLLSRLSSRFGRDKICTLRIKRNYFENRLGLCTLAMKQALNSSARKEEDNLKIYGRDYSRFFLDWWLGDGYGSEAEIAGAKSGKGVLTRSLLVDAVLASVFSAVLWHFGLYVWIILPVIYLLTGIPKGIMTMRHSHISLRESYLVIGTGRFAEIRNYLKYSNVDVVRITRTPLSRFTGRVSLSLSTSGTSFTIRSLREDHAMLIYELLLAKAE